MFLLQRTHTIVSDDDLIKVFLEAQCVYITSRSFWLFTALDQLSVCMCDATELFSFVFTYIRIVLAAWLALKHHKQFHYFHLHFCALDYKIHTRQEARTACAISVTMMNLQILKKIKTSDDGTFFSFIISFGAFALRLFGFHSTNILSEHTANIPSYAFY